MDADRRLRKRQNYYIGRFLYMQTCLTEINCIVLTRWHLRKFLDVDRLDGTRRKWFQDDLERWFPHQTYYHRTKSSSEMYALFLSRDPIRPYLPKGTLFLPQGINCMPDGAPKTMLYSKMSCGKIHDESQIIKELARHNYL